MLTSHSLSKLSNNSPSCSEKIDYAILSAMTEEIQIIENFFLPYKFKKITTSHGEFKIYEYKGKKILILATGLGTTFSSSMMTFVYHQFQPEYILFIGTAGGIKSEVNISDVIVIEKAFEAEIQGVFESVKETPFESCLTHPFVNKKFPQMYSSDCELFNIAKNINLPNIKIHTGIGVSSNTFPAPKELFKKIQRSNSISIDMETSACYQVAWLLEARVLAIRGISNLLNNDGSDDNLHLSNVIDSVKNVTQVTLKMIDELILKDEKIFLKEASTNENIEIKSDSEKLIHQLNLQAHPEGGYFAPTFQSSDQVMSIDKNKYNDETRSAGSAIFYLLKTDDFSAWHKLKSDEIWHFHKGSTVKIYTIDQEGRLLVSILGDTLEHEGASFQVVIKAENYFAAEIMDKNSYALIGCTVAPGFDAKDFQSMDRAELTQRFPQHSEIITQFTRAEKPIERDILQAVI